MTAPITPTISGEVLPASLSARPAGDPPRQPEGRCPVCGAAVTLDGTFAERECGHWILRTAAGVLVASANVVATRARLGAWAYAPVPRAQRVTAGTVLIRK